MAWAGTGVLWSLNAGVLTSRALAQPLPSSDAGAPAGTLNFVQITTAISASRSRQTWMWTRHFAKRFSRINALPVAPEFMLHTAISRTSPRRRSSTGSTDAEDCRTKQVFYVPGEHDILNDNGAMYRERFGRVRAGRAGSASIRRACISLAS